MVTKTAGESTVVNVDLGLVDLLNGLIAAIVSGLRSPQWTSEGEDPGKIPVRSLCNILHEMQQEAEFARDLRYLDFRRIGDNSVSDALGDFLFLGGAWDAHRVPNPRITTITLSEPRAKNRIRQLESEYGLEAIQRLTRMADRFILSLRANARPASQH